MTPKVSVCVAVYNVAAYIERCAVALFKQTLDEVEFIFVDDCSPDDSVARIQHVLEAYPARQPQVKIIHHDHNQGLPQTRLTGVRAATGDYVLLVDGDDYAEPTMLEKMYAKAVDTQSDIVMCDYCHNQDGDPLLGKDGVQFNEDADIPVFSRHNYVWIRLVKREILQAPDFVWPLYAMHEDVIISTQAALHARRVAFVPEVLYHYCTNPQSITRTTSLSSVLTRFNQSVANRSLLFKVVEEKGLSQRYERGILSSQADTLGVLRNHLHHREARKLWRTTFPACHRMLFRGYPEQPTSLAQKVRYLVMATGFFALKRELKNRSKK